MYEDVKVWKPLVCTAFLETTEGIKPDIMPESEVQKLFGIDGHKGVKKEILLLFFLFYRLNCKVQGKLLFFFLTHRWDVSD